MKMSWQKDLLGLFYNTLVCAVIAAVVLDMALASSYGASLKVALSIGYSIQLSYFVFDRFLYPNSSSHWVGLAKSIIGLLLGVAVGGIAIKGTPFFLFYYPAAPEVLIFSAIIAVFSAAFINTTVRLADQKQHILELEAKHLKQEAVTLEAEIHLLQAQIEPHFLFNTLSNIVSLIQTKPAVAEKSLVNLAQLLRFKLDRSRDKTHTLGDELWLLRAYLDLHSMRLGKRLSYHFLPIGIENDTFFTSLDIPPLLIQPMVENAIQHGIEPAVEGGDVSIMVSCGGNELLIQVIDTGIGLEAHSSSTLTNHSGIGLSNVRHRLQAIYAGRATMSIVENEPSGVIVKLALPMEDR